MRDHDPSLCDYIRIDVTNEGARSILLGAPSEPDLTVIEPRTRTRMGNGPKALRAPANRQDATIVIEVCSRCDAPLVTAETSAEVAAQFPVRCNGKCEAITR